MEVELAHTKDLNRLSTWCEVVPEFQKNLTQYMDREDTAILKMENDNQLVGVALLKVMETEKSGTIWLHLNEEGKQHQHTIMQKSLEWLRKKGAKEYHLV